MGLISFLVGTAMDANKAIKQRNAQQNNAAEVKQVKDLYQIEVPGFLSPSHGIEDASLEYSSKSLDILMSVIDEPKEEFLEELNNLREADPELFKDDTNVQALSVISISNIFDLDHTDIINREATLINGLPSIVVECVQERSFFKDAMYGYCAFVEGKQTMYQIQILIGGSSISKLGEQMKPLLHTFKEL